MEQLFFDNIPSVRSDKPGSTDPSDHKAALLFASDPNTRVGTSIMLRVIPGDRFNISADAHYEGDYDGGETVDGNSLVESLMGTLTGGINYDGIPLAELPENIRTVEQTIGNPELADQIQNLLEQNDDPEQPKAHLNYLVFNDEMELVPEESGSVQVPPAAINGWAHIVPYGTTEIQGQVAITEPGYIVVYIDNQSIGKDVWFDNVHVEHYTSEVLEEDHYYPFGLTLSSDAGAGLTPNQYKYNSKELQPEFNLQYYDYGARMYNSQIGRWNGMDEKAEKYPMLSPFAYAANNPVKFIDKDGKDITLSYVRTENKSGDVNITAHATINLTIVDPHGQLTGVDRSYITQYGKTFGADGIVKTLGSGKTAVMNISTDINLNVVKSVDEAKSTDYILQTADDIPGFAMGKAELNGDVGAVEGKYSGKEYSNIALHELGHILGLEHRKGTLMNPTIDDNPSKNTYKLNSGDKAKVWTPLINLTTNGSKKGTIRTFGSPKDSRKELKEFIKKENINVTQ